MSPPELNVDRGKPPWNGEFYASFGHAPSRHWEDARRYGFICAGGGRWYSRSLRVLEPGGCVWVNAAGGRAARPRVPKWQETVERLKQRFGVD